jgi:hypothetical protein
MTLELFVIRWDLGEVARPKQFLQYSRPAGGFGGSGGGGGSILGAACRRSSRCCSSDCHCASTALASLTSMGAIKPWSTCSLIVRSFQPSTSTIWSGSTRSPLTDNWRRAM